MSDFDSNRKKLSALHRGKRLTLWSKFFFDRIGLFWIWSACFNALLKFRGVKKSFGRQMIYRQYAKVFKKVFIKDSSERKQRSVLFFFAMGAESTYNARNLLLAQHFKSKGWSTQFLICDGVYSICHKERIGKTRDESVLFCEECRYGYDFVSEETGMMYERLSSYLPSVQSQLSQPWKCIDAEIKTIHDCLNYRFNDVPIGELVKVSVLRFHYTGAINQCNVGIYKRYLKEGVKCHLLFSQILKSELHDLVVVWNGAGFMDRICTEVCKSRSINYVTQESFWGEASWIYKMNGIAIHLDYREEYRRMRERVRMNEVANKKLDDLLNGFRGDNPLRVGKGVRQQLGLTPDEDYVSLFTNMNFDTYVLGRDVIFESMTDWLVSTIVYFRKVRPSVKLVVRAHPGELKFVTPSMDFVRNAVNPVLHDGVVFVDSDSSIDSYDIMENSFAVLVYSSTVGVESIMMNKLTISAGSTFYDDYVLKANSKEHYYRLLDQLLAGNLNHVPEIQELRQYLYFLYFHRIVELKGFGIDRKSGRDFIDTRLSGRELYDLNFRALDGFYNEIVNEAEA
jgi:hypothetical protein